MKYCPTVYLTINTCSVPVIWNTFDKSQLNCPEFIETEITQVFFDSILVRVIIYSLGFMFYV